MYVKVNVATLGTAGNFSSGDGDRQRANMCVIPKIPGNAGHNSLIKVLTILFL
jgi:hypothetical protein